MKTEIPDLKSECPYFDPQGALINLNEAIKHAHVEYKKALLNANEEYEKFLLMDDSSKKEHYIKEFIKNYGCHSLKPGPSFLPCRLCGKF